MAGAPVPEAVKSLAFVLAAELADCPSEGRLNRASAGRAAAAWSSTSTHSCCGALVHVRDRDQSEYAALFAGEEAYKLTRLPFVAVLTLPACLERLCALPAAM